MAEPGPASAQHRYLGYVDVVDDEAVEGWVADLERPGSLAVVVARGSSGLQRTFRAHFVREDVEAVTGRRGRFGYALPVSALRELGDTVTLVDGAGRPLSGGERIELPAGPRTRPQPEPPFVFLHVQKTGGTSLRLALTGQLRRHEVLLVYPGGSGVVQSEVPSLPLHQRGQFRLLVGHLHLGVDKYLPRAAWYVTFLREPLARLRSHYVHHLAAGTTWTVDGRTLGPAEVVQGGLSPEFDNLTVRMITGMTVGEVPLGQMTPDHVELALELLRTRFAFVGLQDRSDEHLQVLCRILGTSVPQLGQENRGDPDRLRTAPDDLDWDVVRQNNALDVAFHERVRESGLCGRDLRPEGGAPPA